MTAWTWFDGVTADDLPPVVLPVDRAHAVTVDRHARLGSTAREPLTDLAGEIL